MFLIGIDSVEIKRIEKSVLRESFVKRIFSQKELAEFAKKNHKSESMAAAFAAKEAFVKSLGYGMFKIPFNEISLLHRESGEPFLELSEELNGGGKIKDYIFKVSVTHTKEIATAVVFGMIKPL